MTGTIMRVLKQAKSIFLIGLITVFSILLVDGILTASGLLPELPGKVNAYRTRHSVYHHDLKPNYRGHDFWGPLHYELCTDEHGFRISCQKTDNRPETHFDIAFIGDSYTEAVGVPYEESFVGLYAAKHPEYRVANLGVSSYSPSIYLKKVEYWLAQGVTFKHLVVLPDISDIQDEATRYRIYPDSGSVGGLKPLTWTKKLRLSFLDFFKEHFSLTDFFFKKLSNYSAAGEQKKQGTPGLDFLSERSFWTTDFDNTGYGETGVRGGIALALEHMKTLKTLLDKHTIKMSVVVYPWPSQLANDASGHPGVSIWKDFCEREHCATFVDVNPFYFDAIAKSSVRDVVNTYYIHDDVHFNAMGNEVLFNAIDERIRP